MSEDKPKCYTDLRWEKESIKCKGGIDPTYIDENGSHTRPMCDFYQICAQRKMASLHAAAGLSNQTRSLPVISGTQQSTPIITQQTATAIQQLQQQNVQVRTLPTVPVSPVGMGTPAQFTPIQFMSMNSFIPAYLSVPEQIQEGDTLTKYIGRSIIRSMLKAAGHTIAHVFDNIPLKR